MKECIVQYGDGSKVCGDYPANVLEHVIRCRDCKWGQAVNEIGCIRMYDRFTRSAPPQDPDGFCAWGEPKDGDE